MFSLLLRCIHFIPLEMGSLRFHREQGWILCFVSTPKHRKGSPGVKKTHKKTTLLTITTPIYMYTYICKLEGEGNVISSKSSSSPPEGQALA